MYRLLLTLTTVVFLLPAAAARAQFFDGFDGTELGPHWQIVPGPQYLEYNVSGGMLHVTDVPLPSQPSSPTNTASIRAQHAPIAENFVARAILGWDALTPDRRIEFGVLTAAFTYIGRISYVEDAPAGPAIFVHHGAFPPLTFPAPPPGMHEFALSRAGSTMTAWLNGDPLADFPAGSPAEAEYTYIHFTRMFPSPPMQPIHIDFVEVIPSPAVGALGVVGLLTAFKRRRS